MNLLWLPLAIASYLMQAVNGSVDRIIVHREVTKPVVISFWVALFSTTSLALPLIGWLPFSFAQDFQFEIPSISILLLVVLAGAMSQAALLYLYKALHDGEATRVLPTTGAITPVITFLAAFVLLDERLEQASIAAFLVLIFGAVTLSWQPKKAKGRVMSIWLTYAAVASFIFALQSVIAKEIFNQHHFISAFSLMGVGALLFASLLALFSSDVRNELELMFSNKRSARKEQNRSRRQITWIVGNSILGGVAIILLNLSLKLGSPTLVNSLRGVQYAVVFVIALLLSQHHRKLLEEDLTPKTITQKVIGIILVMFGVIILAISS